MLTIRLVEGVAAGVAVGQRWWQCIMMKAVIVTLVAEDVKELLVAMLVTGGNYFGGNGESGTDAGDESGVAAVQASSMLCKQS